jgi:hypothetical protein
MKQITHSQDYKLNNITLWPSLLLYGSLCNQRRTYTELHGEDTELHRGIIMKN